VTMVDRAEAARLMSLAVHELRTPASVIAGYLRMVSRDAEHPLSDRQRKMIEEAEKSCMRLSALIAELSDVAKLDSGVLALAQAPLDLFALSAEVAGGVHEAEDRGVHLELYGPSSGAPLTGDAARLKTSLDAIFRAILREQPQATTIVADRRLASDGGRGAAVLVVAPKESVHAAYESAPGLFDDKRGGLGLLLPMARRVIEAHGGRLWAPADGNGRGAAVISIPITE